MWTSLRSEEAGPAEFLFNLFPRARPRARWEFLRRRALPYQQNQKSLSPLDRKLQKKKNPEKFFPHHLTIKGKKT